MYILFTAAMCPRTLQIRTCSIYSLFEGTFIQYFCLFRYQRLALTKCRRAKENLSESQIWLQAAASLLLTGFMEHPKVSEKKQLGLGGVQRRK